MSKKMMKERKMNKFLLARAYVLVATAICLLNSFLCWPKTIKRIDKALGYYEEIETDEQGAEGDVISEMSMPLSDYYRLIRQSSTPLIRAIMDNKSTAEIKELIDREKNINAQDRYLENTALLRAAQKKNGDAIKLLIDAQADLEKTNAKGNTALIIAVQQEYLNGIQLLLAAGANVNHANKKRYTALTWAARRNNLDALKLLLNAGADVNPIKKTRFSALMWAIKNENEEAVNLLIQKGAATIRNPINEETTLNYAIHSRSLNIVKALIHAGVKINLANFLTAVQDNALDIVKLFTTSKELTTLDSKQKALVLYDALFTAVQNGYTDLAQFLIDSGAPINQRPLSEGFSSKAIDFLFNDNSTLLMRATKKGSEELVKMLIKAGASINAQNKNGNTALIYATTHNFINIASLLIKSGADVHIKNKRGESALSLAKQLNHPEIATLLIKHGAQWNRKDELIKKAKAFAYGYKTF